MATKKEQTAANGGVVGGAEPKKEKKPRNSHQVMVAQEVEGEPGTAKFVILGVLGPSKNLKTAQRNFMIANNIIGATVLIRKIGKALNREKKEIDVFA